MKKLYSAAVGSNNIINIFDVNKGTKSYSINLGTDTLLNGPIITQDKLTVVVKNKNGNIKGKVFSLGTGVLSYSFSVN